MPYISDSLPSEIIDYDFLTRLLLLIPSLVASYIVSKTSPNYRMVQYCLMLNTCLCGLSFSILMLISASADGVLFFNLAFIHVILFAYIFILIPIRNAIPLVLLLCLAHVLTASMVTGKVSSAILVFYITPSITFFAVLSYAGHAMEKSERSGFAYRKALGFEYDNRVKIEKERSKWLSLITDFLRHELKNSLIGISSSLELVFRKNSNEALESYIERARTSTSFMKRLIDEASVSTNLEAVLNNIKLEVTDISSLIISKRDEYSNLYSDCQFDFEIEENLSLLLDPDRLVQALDKLVNNAVEHCDHVHPIRITLRKENNKAYIKVSNIGDVLKDDVDIFQPFISSKAGKSDHNHGLGLFVVKRIAEAHGGEVSARALGAPGGAEFTISLPSQM